MDEWGAAGWEHQALGLNWTLSLLSMGLAAPPPPRPQVLTWQVDTWLPSLLCGSKRNPNAQQVLSVCESRSESAQPRTSPKAQRGDPSLAAEAPCLCVLCPHLKMWISPPPNNRRSPHVPFYLLPTTRAPQGQGARESRPRQRHAKWRLWGLWAGLRGANLGCKIERLPLFLEQLHKAAASPGVISPTSEESKLSFHEFAHSLDMH